MQSWRDPEQHMRNQMREDGREFLRSWVHDSRQLYSKRLAQIGFYRHIAELEIHFLDACANGHRTVQFIFIIRRCGEYFGTISPIRRWQEMLRQELTEVDDWAWRKQIRTEKAVCIGLAARYTKKEPTYANSLEPPYAAILLRLSLLCWPEVADRALPLAQFRSPAICSAINCDSGTNSTRICATSKSVGSRLSVRYRDSHSRLVGSQVKPQQLFAFALFQYFGLLGTGHFEVHFPGQSGHRGR